MIGSAWGGSSLSKNVWKNTVSRRRFSWGESEASKNTSPLGPTSTLDGVTDGVPNAVNSGDKLGSNVSDGNSGNDSDGSADITGGGDCGGTTDGGNAENDGNAVCEGNAVADIIDVCDGTDVKDTPGGINDGITNDGKEVGDVNDDIDGTPTMEKLTETDGTGNSVTGGPPEIEGLPEIGGSGVIDGSIVIGGNSETDAPAVTGGTNVNAGSEGTGRMGENDTTGKPGENDAMSEGNTSDGNGRPDGARVMLGNKVTDGTGGNWVNAGGPDKVGSGDTDTIDGIGGTPVTDGRGGSDGGGDKGAIDDGTIGGLLWGRCDGSMDGKLGGVQVGVGDADSAGPSVNGGKDISGKLGMGGGDLRGRRDVRGETDTETMGGRPGPKSGLSDGSSDGSSDMVGVSSEGPESSGEIPGYQYGGRGRRPDRTATCTSRKQWSDKNAALRDVERNIMWRKNVAGEMRSSENWTHDANAAELGDIHRAHCDRVTELDFHTSSNDSLHPDKLNTTKNANFKRIPKSTPIALTLPKEKTDPIAIDSYDDRRPSWNGVTKRGVQQSRSACEI